MTPARSGQGKLPALQFYPGDWLRDPGVQSLTYHDQGVWLKLLCYMHESHERGKLMLNGRAMTHPEMGRLLGLELPVVEATMADLIDSGVGSIDEETGALISRRMVRDEEGRQQRKMWGKEGGRKAFASDSGQERPGYLFLVRRESDGMMRLGSSVNPQNRLYRLRFENRGEMLVLLAKRAVNNMRTALSSFAAAHQLRAHEWFAQARDAVSSFLSSFQSSPEEDTPFLPPSSSSSSTSLQERERASKQAEGSEKSHATPDADLHPLAAQIVLAHPYARIRNWTVRDIPTDCVVAVLSAARAEAAETGASPSAAATMMLTMVRGIASEVPEAEWRFLKQIPEFMRLRDYRIDPKHLKRQQPANPPAKETSRAQPANSGPRPGPSTANAERRVRSNQAIWAAACAAVGSPGGGDADAAGEGSFSPPGAGPGYRQDVHGGMDGDRPEVRAAAPGRVIEGVAAGREPAEFLPRAG